MVSPGRNESKLRLLDTYNARTRWCHLGKRTSLLMSGDSFRLPFWSTISVCNTNYSICCKKCLLNAPMYVAMYLYNMNIQGVHTPSNCYYTCLLLIIFAVVKYRTLWTNRNWWEVVGNRPVMQSFIYIRFWGCELISQFFSVLISPVFHFIYIYIYIHIYIYILVAYGISRSYLTVSVAKLRWHLSNINMIKKIE